MIWDSVTIKTVLDIVIAGLCIYGLFIFGRNWSRFVKVRLPYHFGFIALSLLIFLTFFTLELLSMYGFPALYGSEWSMRFMTDLHLNWSWPVHLIAVAVIVYSLKRYSTELLPRYLEKTEALTEQLAETTADFNNLANRYH